MLRPFTDPSSACSLYSNLSCPSSYAPAVALLLSPGSSIEHTPSKSINEDLLFKKVCIKVYFVFHGLSLLKAYLKVQIDAHIITFVQNMRLYEGE